MATPFFNVYVKLLPMLFFLPAISYDDVPFWFWWASVEMDWDHKMQSEQESVL